MAERRKSPRTPRASQHLAAGMVDPSSVMLDDEGDQGRGGAGARQPGPLPLRQPPLLPLQPPPSPPPPQQIVQQAPPTPHAVLLGILNNSERSLALHEQQLGCLQSIAASLADVAASNRELLAAAAGRGLSMSSRGAAGAARVAAVPPEAEQMTAEPPAL
jgi:hypothetical protein